MKAYQFCQNYLKELGGVHYPNVQILMADHPCLHKRCCACQIVLQKSQHQWYNMAPQFHLDL
uniref:Uncharacterized protein n=1 Tax=Arundo donax TaxID=35708 RepID=A0A0A9E1B2_ARUDO